MKLENLLTTKLSNLTLDEAHAFILKVRERRRRLEPSKKIVKSQYELALSLATKVQGNDIERLKLLLREARDAASPEAKEGKK